MKTFRYFWLDWCEETRIPVKYFRIPEVGFREDFYEALVDAENYAEKTDFPCTVQAHFENGRVREVAVYPGGRVDIRWKRAAVEEYEVLWYEVEGIGTFPDREQAIQFARNIAAKIGVPVKVVTAYLGCRSSDMLILPDGRIDQASGGTDE